MDATVAANRLACYVPGLREFDNASRLRIILHDFGMVFQDADKPVEIAKRLGWQ